jgi:hypothetical protein
LKIAPCHFFSGPARRLLRAAVSDRPQIFEFAFDIAQVPLDGFSTAFDRRFGAMEIEEADVLQARRKNSVRRIACEA